MFLCMCVALEIIGTSFSLNRLLLDFCFVKQGISILNIFAAKYNSQAKEGPFISDCSHGIIWSLGGRDGNWYCGRDYQKVFGNDK
jgi:hypothetical protein